jgi:hypothetical protein
MMVINPNIPLAAQLHVKMTVFGESRHHVIQKADPANA